MTETDASLSSPVAATSAIASPRLLDDCCVLCNLWVAGAWAQHVRGARHSQWAKAARCAFSAAAPAACAVAAALVRLELRAKLSGPLCRHCREPVAGGFRGAVAHLRSLHHIHREQLPVAATAAPRPSMRSVCATKPPEALVRGVVCALCLCGVTGWPERHFLSRRHQRNAQCRGAQAQARARYVEWEERLKFLIGNICCCCAEHVPHEEIMAHFTSARHTRAQNVGGARAAELQALLQGVPENKDRRYCPVCRTALKSSISIHQQSRAHSMTLIRAFANDENLAERKRIMARLTRAEEEEAQRKEEEEEEEEEAKESNENKKGCLMHVSEGKNNNGAHKVGAQLLPPLLRFVRGKCIMCGEAIAADTTALIALPSSTAHCCAKAKGFTSSDSPTALAGRWLAIAFHALREELIGAWQEPAESQSLHTDADFLQVLESDERAEVFSNAVCAALSAGQLV